MTSVDGIASQATAIQQAQVQNQADIAVAKKTLDAQKQQGDAAVQLIESAARISKSPGTGNLINTTG
ncbi:YjfB family protein [Bremerella sp. T1]|uniref:YjfB family protein n=1 Tax=Bremerella sp. TYQ1 TaxID=3119568 RepID=UPI001CCA0548|nr:YjfB family protein [Bremerella volcania]UBM38135.1 YjfB family protein [Bremerella volcania]